MIHITPIATVDEATFDHVKCPQCHSRLCGKPRNAKVHILRLSGSMNGKQSPLLFTCKRYGNHYLVSTEDK